MHVIKTYLINRGHMEKFPTRHPPPPPSAKEAKDLSNLCSAACDFQNTFFGADNYPRLSGIKTKYDPNDLFIVKSEVGSERWDGDGKGGQQMQ